ncbi:MAG: glycoside hydrolase family 18 protein [Chitinophagales bacterium]|nr:glycoside hydrolase family 18 protein [Chitinophagales bacterium]
MKWYLFVGLSLLMGVSCAEWSKVQKSAQAKVDIIAYYAGNGSDLDQYRFEQLDQVIFSFCHLRGNKLVVDDATDTITIKKLVALKKKHPKLKVLLSLGGWGGCAPCSEVFSNAAGRTEFVRSVKKLMKDFHTDGIDLDWEYPGIEGHPGHLFQKSDKANFTALVRELRQVLGKKAEISFAAGGFDAFFEGSVEWDLVMPLVNRVNIMSYDLVNGYSTVTGHHTPLYSSPGQQLSADYAIKYLEKLGVPRKKMVLGAAFYARVWENVPNQNQGLYQSGKFKSFVPYQRFLTTITEAEGYQFYRDTIAQAPYAYHPAKQLFATFDDRESVRQKALYTKKEQLGGIMFWQLVGDTRENGLLDAIFKAL